MLQEPVTAHSLLREFLKGCLQASPVQQAEHLRQASLLFQFARSVPPQPVTPELERLIAGGAYAKAAAALLDPGARYVLARTPEGAALADVTLPGEERASARAQTTALALLAAHCTALLQQMPCGFPAAEAALPPGARALTGGAVAINCP